MPGILAVLGILAVVDEMAGVHRSLWPGAGAASVGGHRTAYRSRPPRRARGLDSPAMVRRMLDSLCVRLYGKPVRTVPAVLTRCRLNRLSHIWPVETHQQSRPTGPVSSGTSNDARKPSGISRLRAGATPTKLLAETQRVSFDQ
ncbi:hypothetical protein ACQEVC_13700 [Plantactinospora sp. CA-294935]|uniref:hypothetical protein n=1 Tax=Plantactinospora sp. CA-294935 TaxID=3240012 RepID=UPI003D92C601